jgi:F0F1-type ATP synthase epsilon subunit
LASGRCAWTWQTDSSDSSWLKLTVLTTVAKKASDLDAQTAKAEYAEAVARRVTDAKGMEQRQKQIDRARAAMALAGKK